MDARSECDHLLVEEGIARLHTVGHGDPVAFLGHEETGEQHLVAEIERAVERMPAAHAFHIERQVLIGNERAEPLFHLLAVIAVSRPRHEIVHDRLSVRSADHGIDAGEFAET